MASLFSEVLGLISSRPVILMTVSYKVGGKVIQLPKARMCLVSRITTTEFVGRFIGGGQEIYFLPTDCRMLTIEEKSQLDLPVLLI